MNKDVVVLVPIYDPDIEITTNFLKELEKKYSKIVYVNDGSNKKFDEFFA